MNQEQSGFHLKMAENLCLLLNGGISLAEFEQELASWRRKIGSEGQNANTLKNLSPAEFVPYLLNYIREKSAHHLAFRQAAPSPKIKCVPQKKSDKHTSFCRSENQKDGADRSPRAVLFPQMQSRTPSHTSPNLSHSKPDKCGSYSPLSSPQLSRKSSRNKNADCGKISLLSTNPKLNLDDPEDFPPMGLTPKSSSSKKSTPRRITPTPVSKSATSPSSPFPLGTTFSANTSPLSLEEERDFLKLMRNKRRSKSVSPWGNKTSPITNSALKSPPLPVLGDFISSPTIQPFSKSKTPPTEKLIGGSSDTEVDCCKSKINQCDKASGEECPKKKPHTAYLPAEQGKVTHKDKVTILGKVYATCIKENFVPNFTAELFFVVQLLTARTTSPDNSSEDNILSSVHNCVCFAVIVLEELKRLVKFLDKGTLRLLADNPRVKEFSPTLKDELSKMNEKTTSHSKVSETMLTSPLGGVPFSAERDNKQNFSSDQAFHNFRKRRDAFYELVREWEDNHVKPGWIMEEQMGNRIRSLVHQRPELANHYHFARLFISQLLQMCKEETKCRSEEKENSPSIVNSLRRSNPEKFQRLHERLTTPPSSSGPCPPPSFTETQEFFKNFLVCASSHSLNRHTMDLLIVKIVEMNDAKSFREEIKTNVSSENPKTLQTKELQQIFSSNVLSLRILAKFLGFLVFEPYQTFDSRSLSITLDIRNKSPQTFDVLHQLVKAKEESRLVLTVPWVIEYLSLMDRTAPYVEYYKKVLQILVKIYRSSLLKLSKLKINYNSLFLCTILGWFFDIPVFPEALFFKSLCDDKATALHDDRVELQTVEMDSLELVDQKLLYSCCPYLGEIRAVLSESAAGLTTKSGPIKKITPVSAEEPTRISSSNRQLQFQLEENFFRNQPDFLKRTSDFVIERLCSNVMKSSIIPTVLATGSQRIEKYIEKETFSVEEPEQAKDKIRPHILKLIHDTSAEGVDRVLESVRCSKGKCIQAFQSLCPSDVNLQVLNTASCITARLVKEKLLDWTRTTLPNVVEKELFLQFDKIFNSIWHQRQKKVENSQVSSPGIQSQEKDQILYLNSQYTVCKNEEGFRVSSSKQTDTTTETLSNCIRKLQKILADQLRLFSGLSQEENKTGLTDVMSEIITTLKGCRKFKQALQVNVLQLLGQVSVELAFILACRSARGVNMLQDGSVPNELGNLLVTLWTILKELDHEAPLRLLLSKSHMNLLSVTGNAVAAWESLCELLLGIVNAELVRCHEIEHWFIILFEAFSDNKEKSKDIAKAALGFITANQKRRRGLREGISRDASQLHFSLLLGKMLQKYSDDSEICGSVYECLSCAENLTLIAE